HPESIPCRGYVLDEAESGLIRVRRRRVGHHGERLIEHYVDGKLLRPRPHDHGILIPRDEILPCHIVKATGGVIHGTAQHAGERKRCTIDWTVAATGLVILETKHSLIGEDVRIGSLNPPRL